MELRHRRDREDRHHVVLDFMFWPWPERKFGWFFEPTYTYSFSKDHEKSLAVSVGLLIAIP